MTLSTPVLAGALSAVLLISIGGVGAFKGERDRRVLAELELQEVNEKLKKARHCVSLHAAEAKALRHAFYNKDFPTKGKSVIQVHECTGFKIFEQY